MYLHGRWDKIVPNAIGLFEASGPKLSGGPCLPVAMEMPIDPWVVGQMDVRFVVSRWVHR